MSSNCVMEVYSRVTGFMRPVSSWNKGKQAEFKERHHYDEDFKEKKKET